MTIKRFIQITALFAMCLLVFTGCAVRNPKESEELAYRQKGIDALRAGNYEEAIDQFQLALDHSNGRISEVELDICYYKAYSQILAGKYEDAKVTYDALIQYDGKNGKAYLLRGNLQLLSGNVDGACKDYDNGVKYPSEGFNVYLYAYRQLAGMGHEAEGEKYLRQALEVKGNTAEHYRQRGEIYIILKEYANAKEELSKAQNLGDEESKLYMAQVMEIEGNFEGAKAIYENYAKLHENDAFACERLAKVFLEQGHYDEALRYIQQAQSIGGVSDEAALIRYQVIIYEKMGDFEKAKELMAQYMEKYPLDAVAQKELVFLNTR